MNQVHVLHEIFAEHLSGQRHAMACQRLIGTDFSP
jgi:hypothetical protein